jgi:membrane dipeptidase
MVGDARGTKKGRSDRTRSPNAEDDFSDATHDAVVKQTLQQIDVNHRLVEKYSQVLSLVSTAGEILPTFRSGKIPCLIGIEGLHQIGNSASILRMYHRLGARYVTVTHNFNNLYADSAVRPCFVDGTGAL